MTITICSARDEAASMLGVPAIHSLQKKPKSPISRAWLRRAEYELPDGYSVKEGDDGESRIYNSKGRHCPLIDSAYVFGGEGSPVLVDGDLPPESRAIHLKKTYDLTLKSLKMTGGT